MGTKRPWKLRFHYDGARVFPDPENRPESWVIDRSKPIDALQSSHEKAKVISDAEEVSRRGGSATVFYRDPVTGKETTVRTYEPYETALEELPNEEG